MAGFGLSPRRIPGLDADSLVLLTDRTRRHACFEAIVRCFETGTSYTAFRDLRKALHDEKLRAGWTPDLQLRLLDALVSNAKLRSYDGYDEAAREVLALMGTKTALQHLAKWQQVHDYYLARNWPSSAEKLREELPGLRAPAVAPA